MCAEVMCLCAIAGHGGSQELTAGLEGLQQLTKLLVAGSWPSVQCLHLSTPCFGELQFCLLRLSHLN